MTIKTKQETHVFCVKIPWIFKDTFLNIVKRIYLNIGPVPRPSVSPPDFDADPDPMDPVFPRRIPDPDSGPGSGSGSDIGSGSIHKRGGGFLVAL